MTDLQLPDPQRQGRRVRRRVTDLHAELADIERVIDIWRCADQLRARLTPHLDEAIEMSMLRAELGAARRRLLDAIVDAAPLDAQPVVEQ